MSGAEWGLYVHIPFCQTRCTYCDFNIAIGMSEEDHARYARALLAELRQESLLPGPLVSIYFGGGTPSLVAPQLLVQLIEAVRAHKAFSPSIEITMETNPGTVDAAKLELLREAGVNRLSIGAQAMQDDHLSRLNRAHDVKAIYDTVRDARLAGFDNISLDAIYGLPRQTEAEWHETIDGLLGFEPEHLSLYELMVEEGTPLQKSRDRGDLVLPDRDRVAEMADWAEEALAHAGIRPYEISNYARPGRESRHNQLYWQLSPYLALGAGAHAYSQGRRWWNMRNVRRYMEQVEMGADPEAGAEMLSLDEEMREFLWLGLRQRVGVNVAHFRQRFGEDPRGVFPQVLHRLQQSGLVAVQEERLVLTARGRDVANVVARALVDAAVERQA